MMGVMRMMLRMMLMGMESRYEILQVLVLLLLPARRLLLLLPLQLPLLSTLLRLLLPMQLLRVAAVLRPHPRLPRDDVGLGEMCDRRGRGLMRMRRGQMKWSVVNLPIKVLEALLHLLDLGHCRVP